MSGALATSFLMVGYGIAAFWALSWWFPFTGSTPVWFPVLVGGAGIVIFSVAVGVARGRSWALIPAAVLCLVALVWTATWLNEAMSWQVKAVAAGVPIMVLAYVVSAARTARRLR